MGLITDEDVAQVLSQKLNLPLVDCKNVELTNEMLTLVPKEIGEKKIIMPIELRGGKLLLGMANTHGHSVAGHRWSGGHQEGKSI